MIAPCEYWPAHGGLHCGLLGVTFPCPGVVVLHVPVDHCTDASGAIKYAKRVSEGLRGFKLRAVVVATEEEVDIAYVRTARRSWGWESINFESQGLTLSRVLSYVLIHEPTGDDQ